MSLPELMQKLFSECGAIAVMFSIAVVWLAAQLAKERKGREDDRTVALQTIATYSKAYENVVTSNAKIEGFLSARRADGAS